MQDIQLNQNNWTQKNHWEFQQVTQKIQEEAYKVDVMCINCYDIVPISEVHQHSKYCTDVSLSIQKLDQQIYIDQIEFKITKLISSLQRNQSQKILQFALLILQEDYFEISCSKNLKGFIDQLQMLKKENSIQEQIYLERLIVLAREKLKEALAYKANEELKLQNEINAKQEELARLSQEVKQYKSRTEKINSQSSRIKFKGKKLSKPFSQQKEELSSSSVQRDSLPAEKFQMIPIFQEQMDEVSSLVSIENKKIQTSVSGKSSQMSEQDNVIDFNFTQNFTLNSSEDLNQLENAQEEERLRFFYGLCLNQKLKYKSKDLAQYVQISQLYEVNNNTEGKV